MLVHQLRTPGLVGRLGCFSHTESTPLCHRLIHNFWVYLHGDPRGSVDEAHRQYGRPFAPNSGARRDRMLERMRGRPVTLNADAREIVAQAIRDHCDFRRWWLGACNVRSNHVHCVVAAGGVDPAEVMRQLKSWSTRRLRERGEAGPGRVWTHHGSTRHLFDIASVERAMLYTLEHQDGARWRNPEDAARLMK